MSANIDSMMYVGETPWHGLGIDLTENPPKNSEEIIRCASLDWTVNHQMMKTDIHGVVPGWHAIYREDNNEILGVINKKYPVHVQNRDSFHAVNNLIGTEIDVDTAASLGRGEKVFGCFKIRQDYKLMDDEIAHYFVIFNDHLKADGKVTVLNTPVRVVCQNTLSEALNNNYYKIRVPITADTSINSTLATNLIHSVDSAIQQLQVKANDLVSKKVDEVYVNKMLDVLFPYQVIDGSLAATKANEKISETRNLFLSNCMGADNIANYRGTQYQCFMALTDWTQHYYKSADKAYDLNTRMKVLPGIDANAEKSKVVKFLQIADKLAA